MICLFLAVFSHIFQFIWWSYNKLVHKSCYRLRLQVLSVCLQLLLIIRSFVHSKEQRMNMYFGLTRSFSPQWSVCDMKPAFFFFSHCKSTAASKSQQTVYVYQMYPAYPNDKIINLLRLVDSLVRQQFEFILSWEPSLFNLPCRVSLLCWRLSCSQWVKHIV